MVLTVELGGNRMVEREGVPREAPARTECAGHAFERLPAVAPGAQVKQRAERAIDESRLLIECQVAHVAQAQIEVHTRAVGCVPRLREHRR